MSKLQRIEMPSRIHSMDSYRGVQSVLLGGINGNIDVFTLQSLQSSKEMLYALYKSIATELPFPAGVHPLSRGCQGINKGNRLVTIRTEQIREEGVHLPGHPEQLQLPLPPAADQALQRQRNEPDRQFEHDSGDILSRGLY
jgi:hypothetical protein